MFGNRGITFKLIFFILLSCSLIFAVIFGFDYYESRNYIYEHIDTEVEYLSELTAKIIESELQAVERVPETISFFLEYSQYTNEDAVAILKAVIESNPRIFGVAIAFDPKALDSDMKGFAPYYHMSNKASAYKDLTDHKESYLDRKWYKDAKESGSGIWGEPYYEKVTGKNIIMATYAMPFYKRDGKERIFQGVVATDISLTWAQQLLSSIKVRKSGYGFLISKDGNFITHPKDESYLGKSIFDIARKEENKRLHEIAINMTKGDSGKARHQRLIDGKDGWIIYTPLLSSEWSIGIEFPRDEILSDMIRLDKAVILMVPIVVILLFFVIYFISNRITRSLRVLDKQAQEIAKGNLNFEMPTINSNDEVGRLSKSFLKMRDSLIQYIRDLTETTAAKEKIVSELKVARTIQMSLLPRVEPPLSNRREFDIYARLDPAKEVGGDFFDFFMRDDKHLCFAIGDVSGKGVPAALLMAVTKTLIKLLVMEGSSPKTVMEKVNRDICYNNKACSFVTAFLGILDIETGEVVYVNAGHNPPIVLSKSGINALECLGGTVLGASEEAQHKDNKLILNKEDAIFLYTDGVTEAINNSEEMFDEERLIHILKGSSAKSSKTIVKTVLKNVEAFSESEKQFDDITMLCLRLSPTYSTAREFANRSLVLVNDLSEIDKLSHFVLKYGEQNKLSKQVVNDINLALEEIFTNAVTYAYEPGDLHTVLIEADLKESVIILKVEDDGKPFNPLEHQNYDISSSLEKRPIGGLGIMLARNAVDEMHYERQDTKNIITMKKILNLH
ncbi:MAG: SpoIIE family protein phosphatase [Deltaproteobacteria bacterium]|jgi:phosphoserine phosphatase RsbU/P|nr:SpoIIE family protein phosphatase [Deltaproteobacteria bacterium]